jgi:Leucine-rich repeat (LRR) protein
MQLVELLEAHEALARELAAFLSPKDQRPLLELCRASVHSSLRREFFTKTLWSLPPERWLAERVLCAFTMKAVVTSVIVPNGEWQQYMLREFPELTKVEMQTLRSDTKVHALEPQHLPVGQITALDLSESTMGDMAALAAFTKLEKLELPIQASVWNMHVLESLPSLTSLTFGCPDDGAVDLSVLERLPNLREVVVSDMEDTNMKPIGGLKQLEKLVISGCTIHDLAPLQAVAPTLKSFDASDTMCTTWQVRAEDRAAFLSSLVNLRDLQLHNSYLIRGVGLAPLASLVHLTFLELGDEPFDDLSPLASLTELETLMIKGKPGIDWSPISSLTKLKELDQSASTVVDLDPAAARALTSLPLLEKLSNPAALSVNHPLPQVRSLTLTGPSKHDRDAVNIRVALDICCPNVATLRLNGCVDLSSLSLSRLPKLHELTTVQMDTKGASSVHSHRQDLIDYSPVASLHNLTSLSLSQVCKAKDYAFLESLPNLRKLNMVHQSITDISVLGSMPNLQDLVISHARIKDVAVLGKLRNLKLLFMDDTDATDVSCLRGLPLLETLTLPICADCSPLIEEYGVSLPSIKSFSHYSDCLWKDHPDSSRLTFVRAGSNACVSRATPPPPVFPNRVKHYI